MDIYVVTRSDLGDSVGLVVEIGKTLFEAIIKAAQKVYWSYRDAGCNVFVYYKGSIIYVEEDGKVIDSLFF